VPQDLEWDGRDTQAVHLLAQMPGGEAVGTARLLDDGRLGRMAVLPEYRGLGIGSALVQRALSLASERGVGRVFLHAQVGVVSFYRRFGFEPVGDVFEEAGIAHQTMQLAVQ
jgi:predicted GNAT family N-acyltransferase